MNVYICMMMDDSLWAKLRCKEREDCNMDIGLLEDARCYSNGYEAG